MGRRNRDESVFAGPWRRPRRDGRGPSARALQERASLDQEPSRQRRNLPGGTA